MNRVLASMPLLCAIAAASSMPCAGIRAGQEIRIRTSRAANACVSLVVEAARPLRLSAEQPFDLIINAGPAPDAVADSFEFGVETLTLIAPGPYRVTLVPVDPAATAASQTTVRLLDADARSAERWRRAERLATLSKKTGLPADIESSLASWRELNDPAAVARTVLKRGDALLGTENVPEAEAAYEEALTACRQLEFTRCMAEAANNSGYSAFLQAALVRAAERLNEAAGYWRRLSMPLFEGRTLSNLGLMFWQSGDFDRAIHALSDAHNILRGRDGTADALVLNNLGLCYQSLAEHGKAIAYFRSALAFFMENRKPRMAMRARLNLGRSYMLLGRTALAERTLRETLAAAEALADTSGTADALNNLGQTLLAARRPGDAREQLLKALHLYQSVNATRGQSSALHFLGVEAAARNDPDSARRFFSEASRIRLAAGLLDDASESFYTLAELEYRAGDPAAARPQVDRAISLIENVRSKLPNAMLRGSYYARKRRFFDLSTDIAMHSVNGSPELGLLAAEQARGRAILDQVTNGTITGPVPSGILKERGRIRAELDILSARVSESDPSRADEQTRAKIERDREQVRTRIQMLLAEHEQASAVIRKAATTSPVAKPLSSIDELCAALDERTVILEYHLGESRSYLWVIGRNAVRAFTLPPRKRIEGLIAQVAGQFGDILERRRSAEKRRAFDTALRKLAAAILDPISGIRLPPRLVLVLDRGLYRVPMAALKPSWLKEPLGLAFELIQAPSAAYVVSGRRPRPVSTFPRSALVVADPVFSADDPRVQPPVANRRRAEALPRLPFTGELSAVTSAMPRERVRALTGFDASMAALKRARARDYAVLHLSTHASIDDGIPELSWVALSLVDAGGRPQNGYLRPYHLPELGLNGSTVVLSSCRTGLGKEITGEGLAGFATSLFSAGAAQFVLTSSKVDAESSSAFFTEVYRRYLAEPRAGMERSLLAARRAMGRSARWSDPYYWASPMVMGVPAE